jgi:HAD superfamily hydrolase (TIGR01450 family)
MSRDATVFPSFRRWFDQHRDELDAVVLDIDGVLQVGGRAIPGSIQMISRLRRLHVPVSLLTNDGSSSVAQKRQKLNRRGFDFRRDEITSCGDGLVEFVEKRRLRGRLFFVLGSLGSPNYATRAGLRITRNLARLSRCDGVIVGEHEYDWEPAINAVINSFARHPDRLLIAPNPDEYYPGRRGTIRIASGGVARFVQRVLDTCGVALDPIYLGKPYQPIFQHHHALLERRLGRKISRRRVLMLGDSMASDVCGAAGFGYRSGLMLTGLTTEHRLSRLTPKPDLVFRGF